MNHSIESILNKVMSRHNNGHGFQHFKHVLEDIGNPQDEIKAIHVVGTNGKGTTSKYLNDLLMANGLKVGLFTSPHIETHLDRIRVNQENMDGFVFERYYNKYKGLIEDEDLSMFEIDFLFASLYFLECKCDLVIYEAGIGGLKDPTNTLNNKVLNVLTTVDFDHMDRLGNTIEEITRDKVGIVHNHVPLIVGSVSKESEKVIDALDTKVIYADLKQGNTYLEDNYALALCCLKYLGYTKVVEQNELRPLLGRMQKISDDPFIIMDGAHNIQGMTRLCTYMDQLEKPVVVVFACMKDKAVKEMLDLLKQHSDVLYGYQLEMKRAYRFCEEDELNGVFDSFEDVKKQCLKDVSKKGSIVFCGSLYFMSELITNK